MIEIQVNDKLKLIQMGEKHARELFELTDKNRAFLKTWLPWLDFTVKREDTILFIRGTKNLSGLNFVLVYEGKIAGCLGHNEYSPSNKTASLGYWLAEEYGGKGIMSEAVKALVTYSFDEMDVECVIVRAAVENKKSRSLVEKLGFSFEGVLRQREWLYDHFVDHASYSVLRSEWKFFAS